MPSWDPHLPQHHPVLSGLFGKCNANEILFTLYSSCPLKSLYLMLSGEHLFGFWSTTGSKTKRESWTELAHNPLPDKSKRLKEEGHDLRSGAERGIIQRVGPGKISRKSKFELHTKL